MSEPQPAERPTESIGREFGIPLPPVSAWYPVNQQASASQAEVGSQQAQEKAIGQRQQQEQFATRLPVALAPSWHVPTRSSSTLCALARSRPLPLSDAPPPVDPDRHRAAVYRD